MTIHTEFLNRCIDTLDAASERIQQYKPGDILYDVLRAACVKELELVLEQGGQLLRKKLRQWLANNRHADRLTFKDVFRHAAKHGLMSVESCERLARVPRPSQQHDAPVQRGTRRVHA